MNQNLLAKIKNLSNLDNCQSAEDMQNALEKINDLLQENYPENDNREITQEDIEIAIARDEQMGKEIVDYLDQYKGTPTYTEVAKALEFAYQLRDKYDI
jgi:hypothetical protein